MPQKNACGSGKRAVRYFRQVRIQVLQPIRFVFQEKTELTAAEYRKTAFEQANKNT